MKIRNGFVSNSSSSSFCIFGLYLDDTQRNAVCSDGYELNEDVVAKLKAAGCEGVDIVHGQDSAYIGRSITGMGLDETRRQFEDSIRKAIDLLFPGEGVNCGVHEESWYDG